MATVTSSIGTTARDYSTITAWEADIGTGLDTADDQIGECYDDSVFDELVILATESASTTLQAAAGEAHDGTAGSGVRLIPSSTVANNGAVLLVGVSNVLIRLLEVAEWEGAFSWTVAAIKKSSSSAEPVTIAQCVLHDSGSTSASRTYYGVVTQRDSWVLGNVIYNIGSSGIRQGDAFGNDARFLNNTVFNFNENDVSGVGILDAGSGGATRNNLVIAGSTGGACFSEDADLTHSHNAASDTTPTGTGSLTEVDGADQFVSTVGGAEDLHLKTGADCIGAGTDLGTTPSGVELDIDGYDRDAAAVTWDIGADQFVAAGGESPSVSPSASVSSSAAGIMDVSVQQSALVRVRQSAGDIV